MFKRLFISVSFFLLLFFSSVLIAQSEGAVLARGINESDFSQCQKVLLNACPTRDMRCVTDASKKAPVCQQSLYLLTKTNRIPLKVENFDAVNVVQSLKPDSPNEYNYFMIGQAGELIMPSADLVLNKAPGFFKLSKRYPQAKLTNVILSFPEAIFLTQNIQKLLMRQAIIDAVSKEKIGYAKVLYSFTIDGVYQGGQVMRIILIP